MGRCSLEFSAQLSSPGCISFGCRSSAFSLPFWVYALPGGGLRFRLGLVSPGALEVRHVQMDAALDSNPSWQKQPGACIPDYVGLWVWWRGSWTLENWWKLEAGGQHKSLDTPLSRGSWGWVKTIQNLWNPHILENQHQIFPSYVGYFTILYLVHLWPPGAWISLKLTSDPPGRTVAQRGWEKFGLPTDADVFGFSRPPQLQRPYERCMGTFGNNSTIYFYTQI